MLSKELLMMGTTGDELWTLRFKFTGDSYIDLYLEDQTDLPRTLWEGNPSTDIVTIRIPPKSTLLLTHTGGVYTIIYENGCITESYSGHEITITVFQSEAYLELGFAG